MTSEPSQPVPPTEPRRLGGAAGLVVLLFLVIGGLLLFTGFSGAVPEPRDQAGAVDAPLVVYQGEELDISDLRQSGTGNAIGSGVVRFEGLAGDADGAFEAASDSTAVDFTDFSTGTYDTNEDGRTDIVVRTPVVRDVFVRTESGAEVTNGRIPGDKPVDIGARFNFDDADRAEVTVIDPDGLEVTGEVIGTGSANHIATSGETVSADFSDEQSGTYEIQVDGSTLDATRTATITVRSSRPTISLSRQTVQRGESTIATVVGDPGERLQVRIPAGALDGIPTTDSGARQVFDGTGDVVNRVGSNSANAVAAIVELNDNGEGRVRIQSGTLRAGRTTRVELARGTDLSASTITRASLQVEDRTVDIRSAPATVTSGSEFSITGNAYGATTVKAYVRIDDEWRPLFRGSGSRYSEADVRRNGSFTLTIDSSRVINRQESYRIAVAADARSRYAADRRLSFSEFGQLDSTSTTVRIGGGNLRAALSRSVYAYQSGDEVRLTGSTGGSGDTIHVYQVTPRGDLATADTVTARQGEFNRRFSDFPGRGDYRFIVVARGGDGAFESSPQAVRNRLNGRESQVQTLAKIRDEYSPAGSDDRIQELQLAVQSPTLTVTSLPTNSQVEPGRLRIAGTTNRQDRTNVDITVRRNGSVVTTQSARVGADGGWGTTVDLRDQPDGQYELEIDADGTTTFRRFAIASAASEPEPTQPPTETATPEPTTAPPTEMTPSETATPAATSVASTDTATETSGSGPGFGAGIAVAALLVTATAVLTRRRRQ